MDARKLVALFELLESSSSSDDDYLLINAPKVKEPIPKIIDYVEEVVSNYSDHQFKKNFRMSRETSYKLISKFELSDHYPSNITHGGSQPISAESHILSFLWFAGNKSCIRDVSSRFGMGESTFHRVLHRVTDFLVGIAEEVIRFPTTVEAKTSLANEFQKISGIPNVLGCIDGTYIPIRTPAHKIKSTYVNRHDSTSLTLQGICDYKRRFLDVFTGISSKMHDSRVLHLSFIMNDEPTLPTICGSRWHILGDAAYSLREYLLTPYRDYGNLSAEKRNFNYHFCATRVLIENTFGVLKQRFRQLVRTDFHTVLMTSNFILSCCVLHNLCIDEGDLWEGDNIVVTDGDEDEAINVNVNLSDNLQRLLGENKRQAICDLLK